MPERVWRFNSSRPHSVRTFSLRELRSTLLERLILKELLCSTFGQVAQLVRAVALHATGHRFESCLVHI